MKLIIYADGRETRELARAHIAALRAHKCFSQAEIILIPEANLGNEAQEIADHLINTPGLRVLSAREDAYGVYTSPGTPAMYVFRFAELLAHNAVSYHEPLIVANPYMTNVTAAERAKKGRKELERQIRSFRRVMNIPKALSSRLSYSFSGKAGKDNQRSASMKDDMCMALLFGIYWSGQYLTGFIQARGFDRRFSRVEAPVSRPELAAMAVPVGYKRSRSEREDTAAESELDSYAQAARRRKA